MKEGTRIERTCEQCGARFLAYKLADKRFAESLVEQFLTEQPS